MKQLHGNLNPEQQKAVSCTKGPLLIIAGAGAGKTKVLTHRIINLIQEGIKPHNILAITFTNKAAREMNERVTNLLRSSGTMGESTPFLSTFHALGVHILREQSDKAGLPRHFTILDRDDSIRRVRRALKEKNLDPKQYNPRKILGAISRAKGEGYTSERYAEQAEGYTGELVASLWKEYESQLKEENSLDFDDLLLKPVELLKNNEEVRDYYRNKWQYIHIDEYQDTNGVQYALAKLLVNEESNICVVGDADQTIYTWRGANIQNILTFEEDFKDCTTILLEQNYRSTQTILTAANDVIQHNTLRKDKKLYTKNNEGEPIKLLSSFDENNEALTIAEEVQSLVRSGVAPEEIAVLYRANYQSRALEQGFLKLKIPYQLLGTKFFERKEVKDVLSYIRAALNPQSRADIERTINTPKRGIGAKTLEKIFNGEQESLSPAMRKKVNDYFALLMRIKKASEEKRPSEVVKFVIKESGMESSFLSAGDEEKERLENALELATLASKYDSQPTNQEGIEKMLEEAALATDQDQIKEEQKAVRLMTVHASKGLEFDYVFIAGLEEGLFPQHRDGSGHNEAEEERRLFYVALTRARKRVFLSYAQARTIFGSRNFTTPSTFIEDISEDLIEKDESAWESDSFSQGGAVEFLNLEDL